VQGVAIVVVACWVIIWSAIAGGVAFSSLLVNGFVVFFVMTGTVALLLALARRIGSRPLALLAGFLLSGLYLVILWLLGLGLAFYPWDKPDVEVRHGGLVCRAVYGGRTEVRIFKAYPLGLERFEYDYLLNGATDRAPCPWG
jgi:hypothetical protein